MYGTTIVAEPVSASSQNCYVSSARSRRVSAEVMRENTINHYLYLATNIAKKFPLYPGYGSTECEDLVGVGMAAVVEAVDRYDPIRFPNVPIAAYIAKIVNLRIRDEVLKRRNTNGKDGASNLWIGYDDFIGLNGQGLPANEATWADILGDPRVDVGGSVIEGVMFESLINSMGQPHRDICRMFWFEKKKATEIAEIQGLYFTSIYDRINQAKIYIAAVLDDDFDLQKKCITKFWSREPNRKTHVAKH